jgi:hypothetical protein
MLQLLTVESGHTGQPSVGILSCSRDDCKVCIGENLVHLANHAMLQFAILGTLRILWDALNIIAVNLFSRPQNFS